MTNGSTSPGAPTETGGTTDQNASRGAVSNEEMPDQNTAHHLMDGSETHQTTTTNSSANSSSSRISIRIPRNAVATSGTSSGTSSQAALSYGESAEKGQQASGSEEGEEGRDERKDQKPQRGRPKKPIRGRKRRGNADSDESAYSESDVESDESTESEDVYSDDDSAEDSDEEDEDDPAEVWDSRRGKYVAKEPHRSTVPPMTIPFQYASGRAGYAPLAPLPPGAAGIPMFQNYNQRPIAPASGAPGMQGAIPLPFTASQLDVLANNTLNLMLAKAGGASQPPVAETNEAQVPGEDKKAQVADPTVQPTGNPTAGSSAQPSASTPELKNALHALMASQEWRAALLAKLQMNRNISAEQATKLGLRPAAPPAIPPMPMAMPPMRMAMPMMRPMMPMSYYQGTLHPKSSKPKKKKKIPKVLDSGGGGEEGDSTPLAARRERRTPRKSVNYSQFFKDDAEEDEEDEEGTEGSGSDSGPDRKLKKPAERNPKALRVGSSRKRPQRAYEDYGEPENGGGDDNDNDEDEDEDEDKDSLLHGSNSSDDVFYLVPCSNVCRLVWKRFFLIV